MIRTRFLASIVCTLCLQVTTSLAQPVVDGTVDGDEDAYGELLFVQQNATQFGDSTDPSEMTSQGGSEIAGVYATVAGDRLFVLVTGNLESNFNKLEVFFDARDGGWNTIPDDTFSGDSEFGNDYPEVDPYTDGGLNGTGALQRMAGLTFDANFAPDYYATFTNGNEGDVGGRWAFTAHFSELDALASSGGSLPDNPSPVWGAVGGSFEAASEGGILIDSASAVPGTDDDFFVDRESDNSVIQMHAAINNSNIAGVPGGAGEFFDPLDSADVQTGIEFSLPLSQLGNPTSEIKLTAFINGGGHDFVSNQVVGGLPEFTGNLAALADIDFSAIDGEQFVTVSVPGGLLGDFDGNGTLDAADIDLLSLAVGGDDDRFDLNDDGSVNDEDRRVWVEELKSTWFGDSNLDGEFGTADLVAVFSVGQYEDGVPANSGWASGDWNGDQEFDSSDLVRAFAAGGFEMGPRAVAAVPEPSHLTLPLAALGLVMLGHRRRTV